MVERLIVGTETEYGIQARKPVDGEYQTVDPASIPAQLFAVSAFTKAFGLCLNNRIYRFNGAINYQDRTKHPEIATPECHKLDDIPLYEIEGRISIFELTRWLALAEKMECRAYANNTDYYYAPKINGLRQHGYHINIAQDADFDPRQAYPFLATAQIIFAAGVFIPVEQEKLLSKTVKDHFILSARTSNVCVDPPVYGNKNLKYLTIEGGSIVDKDHAQRGCAHYTTFDTNINPDVTKLKIGVLALVQKLLEGGWQYPHPIEEGEVAQNFRSISYFEDRPTPATTIQRIYLEAAERAFGNQPDEDVAWTLRNWRECLEGLEDDPMKLTRLDWVRKLTRAKSPKGKYTPQQLVKLDQGYHTVDPRESWYTYLYGSWYDYPRLAHARNHAPNDTRAIIREYLVKGICDRLQQGGHLPENLTLEWNKVAWSGGELKMEDPYSIDLTDAKSFLKEMICA